MQDLQGKKIVLFGAGKSGGLFIEQNLALNILAVADNDPGKQGGLFNGYPVIAAQQIAQSGCEVIVITSVWSDSILKQLAELGLDHLPTVIPGKREMKGMRDIHPFSHPLTKRLASELVIALNTLTDAAGIDLYLDFGTLLGALREGDFIAWDDDIDFSVNAEQFERLVGLVRENRDSLPVHEGVLWRIEVIATHGVDFAIRITCDNAEGSDAIIPFETDIARRVRRDGSAVVIGAMPEWFCPERHFDGFDPVQLFGTTLKAPSDAYGYLDFVYGEWQVPKKDMSFADYNHSGEVLFEHYDNSIRAL
ncbi:nucleoside-diphosphate sugar epimerase/dehydratase [Pseudomonas sp. KU43P]|uniref:nucleoside-diphosphate sugar epimerase/dehydratase n=1 Tax=Pseudomonas sp. KU43P TaxID=2487887 RepID=UPI002952AB37|nr:LicD family protein [Pseudomonas sp. KU43P]